MVAIPALLLLCAVFGLATTGLAPAAQLVPQVVLVVTVVLLVIQLCSDLVVRRRARRASAPAAREGEPDARRLWADVAWFVAAPGMLYVLGSVIGGGLYAFCFLTLRANVRWPRATGYTVALLILLVAVAIWIPGASGLQGIWRGA
jgi:uncharacterized membrane protein YtjA (UPF0391 family)